MKPSFLMQLFFYIAYDQSWNLVAYNYTFLQKNGDKPMVTKTSWSHLIETFPAFDSSDWEAKEKSTLKISIAVCREYFDTNIFIMCNVWIIVHCPIWNKKGAGWWLLQDKHP